MEVCPQDSGRRLAYVMLTICCPRGLSGAPRCVAVSQTRVVTVFIITFNILLICGFSLQGNFFITLCFAFGCLPPTKLLLQLLNLYDYLSLDISFLSGVP